MKCIFCKKTPRQLGPEKLFFYAGNKRGICEDCGLMVNTAIREKRLKPIECTRFLKETMNGQ